MSRTALIRTALASIILGFICAVWLAHVWLADLRNLAEADIALHGGRYQQAAGIYQSLRGSLWVDGEAEVGLALCSAAEGTALGGFDGSVRPDVPVDNFAFALLMARELRTGDYVAVDAIARLASMYGIASADLYRIASLIERGEMEEARFTWQELDRSRMGLPLGRQIEQAFADYLNDVECVVFDRSGERIGVLDADGVFLPAEEDISRLIQPVYLRNVLHAAPKGAVRLALDLGLSRIAQDALGEERGSVVLLDLETGDILAAVSDERTSRRSDSPAFTQQLEPASISKLITTVAAYRAGIDPDEAIAGTKSVYAKRYNGGILYNPAKLGILEGLDQAMAGSCNIAFADLGVAVGWDGMVDELHRFGFDQGKGNPFPLGKVLKGFGTERELADISIGLEHTQITPLHGVIIAEIFGNSGVLIEPRFIDANDGRLGLSPKRYAPEAGTEVIESQWLPEIFEAMEAVSGPGGTARWIDPPGFQVAMKTGTGGNYTNGFHINYIGFGPVKNPKIAFCVRVTNAPRSATARRGGFDVTSKLLWLLRDHYAR